MLCTPSTSADTAVIRSEYSISYAAIALIFLITGLTLSTRSMYAQARNVRLTVAGGGSGEAATVEVVLGEWSRRTGMRAG
jgi:hypothetical protein